MGSYKLTWHGVGGVCGELQLTWHSVGVVCRELPAAVALCGRCARCGRFLLGVTS